MDEVEPIEHRRAVGLARPVVGGRRRSAPGSSPRRRRRSPPPSPRTCTAWAAKWTACWAEPHWRSTVVPGTVSGKPGGQRGVAPDVHGLLADRHRAAVDRRPRPATGRGRCARRARGAAGRRGRPRASRRAGRSSSRPGSGRRRRSRRSACLHCVRRPLVAGNLAVCQISPARPLPYGHTDRAMDLRFTDDQEAFRAEARALAGRARPRRPARCPRSTPPTGSRPTGPGSGAWPTTGGRWSRGPRSTAGRGVGLFEWLVFEEEYWRAQAPHRVSQNGIFLLAPDPVRVRDRRAASAASSRRWPRDDEIWCQGWSEPDAGSDLAGIRSRARRSESEGGWVLTGQKTWASRGAFAEWCFGLFRTDPEAERHRGLTYFLIDLSSPGVTVRPIPQIDGETRLRRALLRGRASCPTPRCSAAWTRGGRWRWRPPGSERGLSPAQPGSLHRGGRADWSTSMRRTSRPSPQRPDGAPTQWPRPGSTPRRTASTRSGRRPGSARAASVGPEASANKIHWSETDLAIHRTALELLGPDAEVPAGNAPGSTATSSPWPGPIYAGTNEIQRNVVAERMLGLPRG